METESRKRFWGILRVTTAVVAMCLLIVFGIVKPSWGDALPDLPAAQSAWFDVFKNEELLQGARYISLYCYKKLDSDPQVNSGCGEDDETLRGHLRAVFLPPDLKNKMTKHADIPLEGHGIGVIEWTAPVCLWPSSTAMPTLVRIGAAGEVHWDDGVGVNQITFTSSQIERLGTGRERLYPEDRVHLTGYIDPNLLTEWDFSRHCHISSLTPASGGSNLTKQVLAAYREVIRDYPHYLKSGG